MTKGGRETWKEVGDVAADAGEGARMTGVSGSGGRR